MMQPFKFPDEVQKEAPEQPEYELELEGSDEKPEIEVVDDTPPEDRGRKPLDREIEEPTEDELNEYSSKVQKRLKELTHARHDERRKAEALSREKAELERVARAMAEENKRLQEFVNVGQNAYIDKSKSLAEIALTTAKAKFKAALDAGDTEAAVAAQEDMYKAQFEMQQVNSFKPIELQKPKDSVYTEQKPQPPQPQLDDRVVSWAERNPWFEKPGKEDMTGYAYGVHNKLVREYGEAYTRTDEYYRKIDGAMRQAFPDQFDDVEVDTEAPQKQSRPKSVVASAQRTSAPKKIRLTKTQQNVAKRLGIPLELYAKKMAELENQNG
jgi:arsenate reductase-like glutaredoxin family protein